MDAIALRRAASLIAKNNLTPRVVAVWVEWEGDIGKLTVQYLVDGEVGDDERELCQLTLTELAAEFPDIVVADTRCLAIRDAPSEKNGQFVYQRSLNIVGPRSGS